MRRLGNKALGVIALALTAGLFALNGCAAAAGVVKQRVADRAVETAQWYCDQPRSARAVLRVEANDALEGEAAVVIACASDEEGEYDNLRHYFVDPLGDSTLDRLMLTLVEQGGLTLPDGRRLRVVVDEVRQ